MFKRTNYLYKLILQIRFTNPLRKCHPLCKSPLHIMFTRGAQTWKSEIGARGDEIIASDGKEIQELICHLGADGMGAYVIVVRVAAAIPKPAGTWLQ